MWLVGWSTSTQKSVEGMRGHITNLGIATAIYGLLRRNILFYNVFITHARNNILMLNCCQAWTAQ